MKNTKKLLAIVLAVVMVLALSVSAFASDITLHKTYAGHTYTAYQIFAGDVNEEGELQNIVWGEGLSEAGIKAIMEYYGVDTAAKVAFAINEGEAEDLDDLASFLVAGGMDEDGQPVSYLGENADSKLSSGNGDDVTLEGLDSGYYLIVDTKTGEVVNPDAFSKYIVEVVGDDIEMDTKADTTKVEKKVADKNDSTDLDDAEIVWADSADHDIGDTVSYKITTTLPSNYADYDSFKLKLTDTLSNGLTYNEGSAKVSYDGETATILDPAVDGQTLVWNWDDLKATNPDLEAGDTIVITYTVTLNENAVIGSAGNPNTVYGEFSNNPNGEGEGKTPEDKVTVFTYKLVVTKIDGATEDELTGAGFTLYKLDPDNEDADSEGYVAVGTEVSGDNMTVFNWTGLDDGQYKLVETTVPDGYNQADDLIFVVEAEHDSTSDDPQLTKLVVKDVNGNEISSGEDASFTVEMTTDKLPTGTLDTTVVNNSGSELPSTGGIGTTIFTVVGSILVIGAAVLLIAKKRTAAEE